MRLLSWGLLCLAGLATEAQEREEKISYGDFDNWITRQIKESAIIGGATKLVYEVGPTETIIGDEPYVNRGGSPWATSNVLAKVAGITKTNTSVFPEERGEGMCARLDTRLESVKVLGVVNITVIAAGSMHLGSMHEPIRGTKNPQKILESGIPFTNRPVAVRYDYKVKMSGRPNRIRSTGFSRTTEVEGMDYPEVILLLQKRWEDEKGDIYAHRVGTMVVRYDKTVEEWQNDATYTVLYGDITGHPDYQPELMMLQREERYAVNSKGESVPIREVGWADAGETPTHVFLQFASSHGGAYIGAPGNSLWVDNVRFVY